MSEYMPEQDALRERALKRLKAKRDLRGHLLAYVSVNLFLVGLWYLTSSGFFWPAIVMLGWGIGVVMNVWDVYSPEASEADVEKEMDRLRR